MSPDQTSSQQLRKELLWTLLAAATSFALPAVFARGCHTPEEQGGVDTAVVAGTRGVGGTAGVAGTRGVAGAASVADTREVAGAASAPSDPHPSKAQRNTTWFDAGWSDKNVRDRVCREKYPDYAKTGCTNYPLRKPARFGKTAPNLCQASCEDTDSAWSQQLDSIDKAIAALGPTDLADRTARRSPMEQLLDARATVETLAAREPRFRFSGFSMHLQAFMYPWFVLVLGSLWLYERRIAKHDGVPAPEAPDTIVIGLVFYILTRWAHWWRTYYEPEAPDRQVFSYMHHDLFPASFWLDQILFLCVCWMLAALCCGWIATANKHLTKGLPSEYGPPKLELLDTISRAFFRWQVASLGLAAAFMYLTFVYWRIIWKDHDYRYIVSAGLVHVLWIVAWACASWPLKVLWDRWQSERSRALRDVWRLAELERAKARLEFLREVHPVGMWRLAGSLLLAVGSLILPVAKALFELL